MAKYNDAMDNVEMTDEMQKRILKNVSTHFAKNEKQTSANKIVRLLVPAATLMAAACLVLVLISVNSSVNKKSDGNYGAAHGNTMPSANNTSSDKFQAVDGITGAGNNESDSVFVPSGADTDNKTVHFNSYSANEINEFVAPANAKEVELAGKKLTVEITDDNMVCTAWWTEGDNFFIINAENPLTMEELEKYIRNLGEE